MWSHPRWPERHRFDRRDQLSSYVQWCTAVEGNTTFYGLAAPGRQQRWLTSMPENFRMVCKVPQQITHQARLRAGHEQWRQFWQWLEPMAERGSMVTLQMPSSFGPGDLEALDAALRQVPEAVAASVEVRHRSFFVDDAERNALVTLLARHHVELVILDSRTLYAAPPTTEAERAAWGRKPRLPVVVGALTEQPIVRLIGRDADAATEAGWEPWVEVFRQWIVEGRTPTMFVHTPSNDESPALARRFHAALAAVLPSLAPLPGVQHATGQMGLFDE